MLMARGEPFSRGVDIVGTDGSLVALGWAAILLGTSWVAWDILAALSSYFLFFQGNLGNAALVQFFLVHNIERIFTASASALVVIVGYETVRGRSQRKTLLAVIVGVFCFGVATLSTFGYPFSFGWNAYLLQGSVLATGGTLFLMRDERGFRLAGFFVGTLAIILFYMGNLPFPPGFYDYLTTVVSSPYFVYFWGLLGRWAIVSDTLQVLGVSTAILLAVIPVALGSWAMRAYLTNQKSAVARVLDSLLVLSGFVFGIVLVAVSCFAASMIGSLLFFVLTPPSLIPGSLAIWIIVSILMTGLLVSALQAVGGAITALGCALWFSRFRINAPDVADGSEISSAPCKHENVARGVLTEKLTF
ncbi:MAG: hypothetical protein ABSG92_08785 [Conexivisphaerales archaeon]